VASAGDSDNNSKAVIGIERIIMNKARLEWVVSGLNQYALTQAEAQFLKTALGDFDKNHALTEGQEDRLEGLYKLKSQSIPNKKSDRFSVKKSVPKKVRPQRPRIRPY
jgi:hypothetical protein